MCLPFPSPTQLLLRFFVTGFQQLIMMCYVVDFISLKSSLNFLNLYIYSFLHIGTNFRHFLLKYFSVSPSHDPPVTPIIHVLGQLVLMYRPLMHCSFFSCLFLCVCFIFCSFYVFKCTKLFFCCVEFINPIQWIFISIINFSSLEI